MYVHHVHCTDRCGIFFAIVNSSVAVVVTAVSMVMSTMVWVDVEHHHDGNDDAHRRHNQ